MTGLIEHEVIIDRYTKITLSIPKQLDATELKSLMTKANKLFSLSEIEIQSKGTRLIQNRHRWNKEENDFLIALAKSNVRLNEVIKLFNERFKCEMPPQRIEAQFCGLKRQLKGARK